MNYTKFQLIAIVIATGLFTGMYLTDGEAADYFPLEVGNRWVYTPSYGNGDRIDTIIGTETVDGFFTYVWKREEATGDNYHEKRWLNKDGSDLRVYKIWGNEGDTNQGILVTPPWIQDKLSPNVGDTWQFEIDLDYVTHRATYYVESTSDTVTVPAGTFNNCIRVRELWQEAQEGVTEYDYDKHWLAPDIGPVLYRDYTENWQDVNFSQELLSFSNIGSIHIDINTNQAEYEVDDTLNMYLSVYNVGTCQLVDIYIAIQLTDGTLLFYPHFNTTVQPAFTSENICTSPHINHITLLEFTIPNILPSGTYFWYSVITSAGASLYDVLNWLSFDQAPFEHRGIFLVQYKSIEIDGNYDDWEESDRLYLDTDGPECGDVPGQDIKEVYIAQDDNFIYLRYVLNGPLDETFGYKFGDGQLHTYVGQRNAEGHISYAYESSNLNLPSSFVAVTDNQFECKFFKTDVCIWQEKDLNAWCDQGKETVCRDFCRLPEIRNLGF